MAEITKEKYKELKQTYKKEKKRTQNLEKAVQSLKEQLAQVMTQSAANFKGLEKQYDRLQKKYDKLHSSQTNSTKEHELVESLQKQIDGDAETIRGLQESYAKEKQHREDLQKQLEENKENKENNESKEVPDPNVMSQTADMNIASAEESLKQLKKIKRMTIRETEYRKSLQDMSSVSRVLQEELAQHKETSMKRYGKLQKEYYELEQMYGKLGLLNKRKEEQIRELKVECGQRVEQKDALILNLKGKLKTLEHQLNRKKLACEKIRSKCHELESMHEIQKKRAQKWGEDVNQLQSQEQLRRRLLDEFTLAPLLESNSRC